MKYEVDGWNNFCRVFKIPELSSEYCFGGGIATNFQMVDWFNPITGLPQPAVTKDVWIEKVGDIDVKKVELADLKRQFEEYKETRKFIDKDSSYLVLFDFGASLMF